MAKPKKINEDTPMLQILQQIKDKTLPPRLVPKEMKALIVGYLSFEGWTHPQIAQLFEFNEKNAQRAHRDFEKMVQVVTSLEFVRRKVGYFICAADNQVAALLRIARSPDTANPDRIAAEAKAWDIRKDIITTLQSLGFLPRQPQQISADLFHHTADAEQSPEEMIKLLDTIEQEGLEAGVLDEEVKKKIKSIKVKIQQIEISQEITELKKETEKKENPDEPEPM